MRGQRLYIYVFLLFYLRLLSLLLTCALLWAELSCHSRQKSLALVPAGLLNLVLRLGEYHNNSHMRLHFHSRTQRKAIIDHPCKNQRCPLLSPLLLRVPVSSLPHRVSHFPCAQCSAPSLADRHYRGWWWTHRGISQVQVQQSQLQQNGHKYF